MLASALNYPGRHPDLIAREHAALTGIHNMLRILTQHLCPESEIPSELASLRPGWLWDVHAFHTYELAQLEKAREESPEQ